MAKCCRQGFRRDSTGFQMKTLPEHTGQSALFAGEIANPCLADNGRTLKSTPEYPGSIADRKDFPPRHCQLDWGLVAV